MKQGLPQGIEQGIQRGIEQRIAQASIKQLDTWLVRLFSVATQTD
ncbi:MAG TPA: hypothetical protein VH165_04850 [Kofleriaceae bacterium]|nr:hypothetical protein [Kofleriaceae bacterium]